MSISKTKAKKVKDLRIQGSWTQKELAELLGLPQSTISFFETAKREIPPTILEKITELLSAQKRQQRSSTTNGQTAESNGSVDKMTVLTDAIVASVPEVPTSEPTPEPVATYEKVAEPVVTTTPSLTQHLDGLEAQVGPAHFRTTLKIFADTFSDADRMDMLVTLCTFINTPAKVSALITILLDDEDAEPAFLAVLTELAAETSQEV